MVRETGLAMLIKQIVLCIRKGVCARESGGVQGRGTVRNSPFLLLGNSEFKVKRGCLRML
jgi:hypothetical protein